MQDSLRKSEQLYKCSDNYAKIKQYIFAKKAQSINRAIKKNKINYVTWFFDCSIQKMWQIKLPLRQRQRTWAQLLSLCKYAWHEANYDLCFHQIQISSGRSINKSPSNTTNYRKNQQYKSGVNSKKNIFLKNKLWHLKWIIPP